MKKKKLLSGVLAGVTAVISSGLMSVTVSAAGDVAINETNFPDETFRNYVSANFDTDNDGFLSEGECNRVSVIDFQHTDCEECTSFKGIEFFPYLDKLLCFDSKVSSLDISKNTGLREVSLYNMPLDSIDVSKNTNLTLLGCEKTNITEIDVSKNTELETLYCGDNSLTSLDLTKNTKLENLNISKNMIKSIDLSKNTRLYSLICDDNPLLSLDVSKNTRLSMLWCNSTKVTSLDLSKNTALSSTSSMMQYNSLNIGETTTELDLTLLEKYGFDISKASNWSGGTLDGKKLKRIMGMVSYTYSTGSKPMTVYLYCRDPADISLTGDEPDPDPDPVIKPLADTVWVGGKDIKDDKKTASVDETAYYKTFSYQCEGKYSGGKWCVAVTTGDIATVKDFVALYTDGKLNDAGKKAAADGKKLASAKIKEGVITVTSGKEAGKVNVWLYELKKDAATKKNIIVNANGIEPAMKSIDVLMASGSPIIAEKLTNGTASKSVSKLELGIDYCQDLYIGDKNTAFDPRAGFKVESSDETVAEVVAESYKGNWIITITGRKVGKATVTATSIQSGKKTKITVECKNDENLGSKIS